MFKNNIINKIIKTDEKYYTANIPITHEFISSNKIINFKWTPYIFIKRNFCFINKKSINYFNNYYFYWFWIKKTNKNNNYALKKKEKKMEKISKIVSKFFIRLLSDKIIKKN